MVKEVIHHHHDDSGGGSQNMAITLLVIGVLVFLFFYFGLPAIRQSVPDTTNINVPDQIDVTVQQE